MNRRPVLSERLKTVASLVIPGMPMADVGTDHGALPLYCLETEIVPFAVLSDVNEGPLSRAKMRMESSKISSDCYSLRLGSGLSVLKPEEVATVVMAGMGGELSASLIEADPDVAKTVQRFVFQPRSRAGMLRSWLWSHGYRICEEKLAREKDRLCQVFCAEKGIQTPYLYPDIPLCDDPAMIDFLDREIRNINIIIDNLFKSNTLKDHSTAEALHRKAADLEQRRDELWKNNFS